MTAAAILALDAIVDPQGAPARARALVMTEPLSAEDRQIVRSILQPWWEAEINAKKMLYFAGELVERDGRGSAAHRRAALLAALCARTVTHLAGRWSEKTRGSLDQIEAWAWGDATVDLSVVEAALRREHGCPLGPSRHATLAATSAARCLPLDAARHAVEADDMARDCPRRYPTAPRRLCWTLDHLIRAACPEVPV